MAAITGVQAQAPSVSATDWREIADLYDVLLQVWPSPVVALNRAVALGEADGPLAGLAALDELATEPQLAGYHYLPREQSFCTASPAGQRPVLDTGRSGPAC